jgi:hypothetical protein
LIGWHRGRETRDQTTCCRDEDIESSQVQEITGNRTITCWALLVGVPMPSWDLEETLSSVERLHGCRQVALLRPCLRSLDDRQFYAGYHYHEYKRLLYESIDAQLSEKHIFELTFPRNEESLTRIATLEKKVGAHVVASVQSLHSVVDILAHAVCYALALNLGERPLGERSVTVKNVMDRLSYVPPLLSMHDVFKDIRANKEFVYLSALVNHSKHRSIVEPVLSVGFLDDPGPPYTIKFSRFTYDGITYDKRNVDEVLEPVYSWLSFQIAACGAPLNAALRDMSPDPETS